jgi:hypothetical protein
MDEKFYEIVEKYLKQAREVEKQTSMPQASSSILYAAACYNALYYLDQQNGQTHNDIESFIESYAGIYAEMLRNSIEYYSKYENK